MRKNILPGKENEQFLSLGFDISPLGENSRFLRLNFTNFEEKFCLAQDKCRIGKNGEKKLKLKVLLGLEEEVGSIFKQYTEGFETRVVKDAVTLQHMLAETLQGAGEAECFLNTLLIAATDETIALGKQYGMATMAYANPDIPNQTYAGVDMIVEGFEEVDANFLKKVYQRCHHIPWEIARTKRCVIRELSLDDLDALFELYADGELSKYVENLYPYEEEKEFQRAYIENMYRLYGYGMWLVFSKETGELIGRAGLEHREYDGEIELELGYLIGAKHQGQGYATEVCQMILQIAQAMTDFPRINCLIDAENTDSIRLAEKLQFVYKEDIMMNEKRMRRYIRGLC